MAANKQKKTGTVRALNVSPEGIYEGLLLDSHDEMIQINFRPELSSVVAELAQAGKAIQAQVEPQEPHGKPSHPVYRLLSITAADDKAHSLHINDGVSKHSFSGKVARLNYALHGEVNGAILDSGDFLHLRPEGAAAAALAIGMSVKGSAHRKPMVGGTHVLEAEDVNGIRIAKKPKPKKKAHHHALQRSK